MRNLRAYLRALSDLGHMKTVTDEVDWACEASALTATSYREVGPALHFKKIKGYPDGYSMAGGLFTGPGNLYLESFKYWTRSCIAMDLDPETDYPTFQSACMERLQHPIMPVMVESGPVKDVIKKGADADVTSLPIPIVHPGDGGRYGTLQTMAIKDVDTDWVVWENIRTMVIDGNHLVAHIPKDSNTEKLFKKYQALNRPMPFCLIIGGPPTVTMASFLPLSRGASPAAAAGGLNLDPIELIKAETNDLLIPAQAEVVIEGEVSTTETHTEGPYPHYWMNQTHDKSPVLKVNAISQRKDPIIPISVDGVKHSCACNLQGLMLSYELYNRFVNIRNFATQWIQIPLEFNFNVVIACMPPLFPGWASWVGKYALAQSRNLGSLFSKVIVVDNNTSPAALEETIAILMQRTNTSKSYHYREGLPIGPNARWASKEERDRGTTKGVYIDTFWPFEWPKDDIPRRCNIEGSYPEEMINNVVENYNKYGFEGKPVVYKESIIPF
jgi:phenacrylate decarboxylase